MQRMASVVLFGAFLAAGVTISAAEDRYSKSTLAVDTSARAYSTREMLEHVTPAISVYAVYPTATDCRGESCGPTVRFFVLNPSLAGPQSFLIDCSASDHANGLIASSSEHVQVPSSQALASQVVFRGVDFLRIASVTCSIEN